jgi:TolB protein
MPGAAYVALLVLLFAAAACAEEIPGGTLVFSSLRGGAWTLWTCRADGQGAKQLTDGKAGEDADPQWSPDGKRVAFTRLRDGIPSVWTMAADGSGAQRVCEGQQPSWAPDGKGLLFCRDGQVMLRDLAGHSEKRLSPGMWEQCAFPAMSPDQSRVICSSRHEGVIGLYVIRLADGAAERLATSKEACTPRWSPDGKTILFQTSSHVCAILADEKDEEDVTFGAGIQHQGQFSPDAAWIVFTRGNGPEGPWRLSLLERATGAERPVAFEGSARYPDWKKD